VKALSGLKEKRARLMLPRQDLERLVSLLSVIKPELPAYQQALAESWSAAQLNARTDLPEPIDVLKILTCLQTLLPKFEQLIEKHHYEDKNNRMRVAITEEDGNELRVLAYCARHLPDTSIAWSEFSRALSPLLAALDESAFEQMMSLIAPRAASCRAEDFKRGRDKHALDVTTHDDNEMIEELDGFDWNV
jgi:hypothetical protein